MEKLHKLGPILEQEGARLWRRAEAVRRNNPTLTGLLMRSASACLLIGITYAALYMSVGSPFHYGGPAWSTMLIWAAAQGAGWVFGVVLHLPALLGQILIGLILQNAAPSSVSGLPASWSSFLRTIALATIFLRSGLELDLKVFRRVGPAAVRLLLIPGLTEATVDGLLAMPILGLPILWGMSLGFILKAVGPAIVITTMHEVSKQRLGVAKGIPSIIVCAASFDDMVALTGYGLFSNFAFAHTGANLGWSIAHGPVEICLGTVAGFVGALFCSCTWLWRSRAQRTVVAFVTSVALCFTFYSYNMRSAGPLSCLVTGMVLRVLLDNGWPSLLSTGATPEYAQRIERDMGVLWRWVCQPLLFGIIGTLVNLRRTTPGLIPRALGLILTGIAVRMPMSYLAVGGAGLTVLERVFVAVAWTPKATVQAALGPLPLDTILAKEGPDSPNIAYAEAVLTTSVLAILVCGTFGVLGIHILAPKCLAAGNDPSPGTAERKLWLAQLADHAQQGHAEAGMSTGTADMHVRVDAPAAGAVQLAVPRAASGVGVVTAVRASDRSDEQWLRDVSGGQELPPLQLADTLTEIGEIRSSASSDDDDTHSNESYESWRHALHAALSQTRYSLATFFVSAANLLPSRTSRALRAPSRCAQRRVYLNRQGLEVHTRALSADQRAPHAAITPSPSAPCVMQRPDLGLWPELGGAAWDTHTTTLDTPPHIPLTNTNTDTSTHRRLSQLRTVHETNTTGSGAHATMGLGVVGGSQVAAHHEGDTGGASGSMSGPSTPPAAPESVQSAPADFDMSNSDEALLPLPPCLYNSNNQPSTR